MTATRTTQNNVTKITVDGYVFTMLRSGKDEISNMRFENGESAWAHCWDLCKSGILRVKSQKVSGVGYHDTFFLNIKVA